MVRVVKTAQEKKSVKLLKKRLNRAINITASRLATDKSAEHEGSFKKFTKQASKRSSSEAQTLRRLRRGAALYTQIDTPKAAEVVPMPVLPIRPRMVRKRGGPVELAVVPRKLKPVNRKGRLIPLFKPKVQLKAKAKARINEREDEYEDDGFIVNKNQQLTARERAALNIAKGNIRNLEYEIGLKAPLQRKLPDIFRYL